jgi:hypothetical protein
MTTLAPNDFYPFNYQGVEVREGNMVVIRIPGRHLCGYVAFPKDETPESWRGNYDADALQYLAVHGGLTYAEVKGDWCVFGFDCAHVDDDKNPALSDSTHVLGLTRQMRDQMIAFRSRLDEWRAAGRDQRIHIVEEIRQVAPAKCGLGFGAMIGALSGAPEFGEAGGA